MGRHSFLVSTVALWIMVFDDFDQSVYVIVYCYIYKLFNGYCINRQSSPMLSPRVKVGAFMVPIYESFLDKRNVYSIDYCVVVVLADWYTNILYSLDFIDFVT